MIGSKLPSIFALSVGLTMLSAAPSLQAQEKSRQLDPGLTSRIDAFLEQTAAEHEIPGVAVAITSAEATLYVKALGVTDLSSGEELRPEHLFHFASVSKPFVATAIVQLLERGKIDLDAKVTQYLPYFELADERYREITIRQMLNHTSGMPDVLDYEWNKPQYDVGAAERYVRSLSGEKMLFGPGEDWRYSNMAFDTLGDVIQKVSGQPFEDFVAENILQPLGMKNSTFLYASSASSSSSPRRNWV